MPAVAPAPSSPTALRQWTTDVVAPPARLDYWVGAICEAFLEMDCSSREAPLFGGELSGSVHQGKGTVWGINSHESTDPRRLKRGR